MDIEDFINLQNCEKNRQCHLFNNENPTRSFSRLAKAMKVNDSLSQLKKSNVDGTTSDFVCKDEQNKESINYYKSIYTVTPESLTMLDEKKLLDDLSEQHNV